MKNGAWMNKNSGMTLVELLVAMVVGLILLGGVYVSFVSSTTTNSMNEQLSRMQENGRFATSFLTREIRGAGYLGCLQDVNSLKNTLTPFDPDNPNSIVAFLYDFTLAIQGFESLGGGKWKDNNSGNLEYTWTQLNSEFSLGFAVEPNQSSDILIVRGMESSSIFLDVIPAPTSADIKISGTSEELKSIKINDVLLISDCKHAAVFQVTNYNAENGNMIHNIGNVPVGPGNYTKLFDHPDGKFVEGQLFKPMSSVYFIRNNANNIPSLYRSYPAISQTSEIVEGVETMQIRYGEDDTGNRSADEYRTADDVVNWANVVSVRIGLLLRSPSELLRGETDGEPYIVNDTTIVAPADRRLRTVMSTTIGIRNRLR